MKSTYLRFFVGIILVIGAVMFLGASQNWWEINSEFNGALGLIPIIPALVWIFFLGANFVNSFMYFGGIWLVLFGKDFINSDNWLAWTIVLLIVSIGVSLLGTLANSPEDVNVLLRKPLSINRREIFAETKLIPKHYETEFEGLTRGVISSAFTKCGLTLSKCTFEKNCKISLKCSFGSMKIVLPKNTQVVINASKSFGSVNNNLKPVNEMVQKVHKVQIDASVLFGSITILNVKEEPAPPPAVLPVQESVAKA